MTDQTTSTFETEHEREAYSLGCDAARSAASWVLDGNSDADHYRRLLTMLEDGDPELYEHLPAMPDLSGQWAGDPTPHSLALDIFGTGDDAHLFENEDVEALADAWEAGVSDTFGPECERILRAALPEDES